MDNTESNQTQGMNSGGTEDRSATHVYLLFNELWFLFYFHWKTNCHRNDWSSSCRMKPVSLSNNYGMESGQKKQQKLYLGCLTKKQLIMLSVAVGLVVLLIIIIVPAVVLTKKGTFSKMCATYISLNCFERFCPLQRLNIWDCVC